MKGKNFLKVTGILMIIFAAIALIMDIITLVVFRSFASADVRAGLSESIQTIALAAFIGIIFSCVGAALEMVTGILGIVNCRKPQKATICIVFGFILLALEIASLILTFVGGSVGAATIIISVITGLALPVLYLIGAFLNKKSFNDVIDQFIQQTAVEPEITIDAYVNINNEPANNNAEEE